MVRILFLQNILYEFPSTTQLSALLKQAGHECEVLISTEEESVLKEVEAYQPHIVAFTCTTGAHHWPLKMAKSIKRKHPHVQTFFGGTHPTYFPEMIQEDGVDVICRGEGESAFIEFVDGLEEGKVSPHIANLWVKEGAQIVKNGLGPLLQDLDALPTPDREIYYRRYPFLRDEPRKSFSTTRGCSYRCSFCFHSGLQPMTKGKGKYVRRRSVDRVLAEVAKAR